MSTRRWIWIMLVCSLAITFGIWAYCSHREPTYEGRTLRSWLIEYGNDRRGDPVGAKHRPAANAVGQIGTNALPTLVAWTRYEVPIWELKAGWVAGKVGLIRTSPYYFKRREAQAKLAADGFEILGTNAAPAIPDLVALATTNNRSNTTLFVTSFFVQTSWHAVNALHRMGRPGALALASILKNPAVPHRQSIRRSITVFLGVGTNADVSIPALVGCLDDSDPEVRRNAEIGLEKFAPELLTNAVPQ